MMWRSNACKPWLLAFFTSSRHSSLDMDLQVKHVEFDTRPCAMISAWCASPWQVSLADLTLNHGAWKNTLSWSLVLSVWAIDWCAALRFCSVWVRVMSKRTQRETWSASKISSKNNMCSHSSMSARIFSHKPLSHTGQPQATLQSLTTVYNIVYINVWICAPYRASRIQTWRFCNCILQYPTVSYSFMVNSGAVLPAPLWQLFFHSSHAGDPWQVPVPHCWSLACHNLLPFIPSFVSNLKLGSVLNIPTH